MLKSLGLIFAAAMSMAGFPSTASAVQEDRSIHLPDLFGSDRHIRHDRWLNGDQHRPGGQRAHQKWKRTRAAGITRRKRA